jgi:hypothetical protein
MAMGEEDAGVLPDPGGSIAKEDDDLRQGESAPEGLGAEAPVSRTADFCTASSEGFNRVPMD